MLDPTATSAGLPLYFAGKISSDDWRLTLFPDLRQARLPGNPPPESVSVTAPGGFLVAYTGPFFISCDHGCWHGPGTHGVGVGLPSTDGGVADPEIDVVRRSLAGIARAERVFAFVENPSAYGTFAEMGFAAALGRPIFLALDTRQPIAWSRDAWFVLRLASTVYLARDVLDAWQAFAASL
jgi:hypothetical protein